MAKGNPVKPARSPNESASSSIASCPLTLADFIAFVTQYAEKESQFKCYRGQRDIAWPNIPGLFRPNLVQLERNEKRAVRDLISVHPNEFADDESMFDKLVRMQHFGLPTRLMNVSQNPLVALYFATDSGPDRSASDGAVTAFAIPEGRVKYFDSDSVSCLANLSNMTAREKCDIIHQCHPRLEGTTKTKKHEIDRFNEKAVILRLHQFIRAEKPYFQPIIDPIDLFKPYYVHPKMSNRRILSQAGGFVIHGLRPPKQIHFADEIRETKVVIRQAAKAPLRKELELLGISESTLFPELDRATKRITRSYTAA